MRERSRIEVQRWASASWSNVFDASATSMHGWHNNKLRCTVVGGNRDGFEAPHSFAFKNRSDVTAIELAQVELQRGDVENARDVFVV